MTPRVYVEPPCPVSFTLDARQSHHLVRVLRVGNGSSLEIFDGSGRVWQATVAAARANACGIERGSLISQQPPSVPAVHLAQALLKNDAMDRLLRQATELGIAQIWPLWSARTQRAQSRANTRHDHWQRVIVGACEQSRRPHLPILHDARSGADFIESADPERTLMLHPGAPTLPRNLKRNQTTILVGPEGGWSDGEVSEANTRGIAIFSLGTLVLRAETAPLAALAAIRHSWGWN